MPPYFRRDHTGGTVAPDGSSGARLTFGGTQLMPNTAGMWSRQGNQIAYIHYGAANCDGSVDAEIWVMAANGSSKKRLTPCGVDAKWLSWGP